MARDRLSNRSRLSRKFNKELDRNLSAGEEVQVVITGPSDQAIAGTQRRVFVYKKGIFAGATFGSELTSWDYRNVTGVQIHTGMMSGAVIIQAPGQSGIKTSYWRDGDDDPWKAPNAIPVTRPFDEAKSGVARLRQLIDAAHAGESGNSARPSPPPSPTPAPPGGSPSLAEEISRLAELHRSGALSDEEFAALKQRLIAGA